MELITRLKSLADKLGLIKVVTRVHGGTGVPKVATRAVRLDELAAEVRREQVEALAQSPAELGVAIDRVYEAAGVKPPAHGWTAARVHELVTRGGLEKSERANAQRAILSAMEADKAAAEDVVRDAVGRDRALDAYEAFVEKKMDQRRAARKQQADELREKIEEIKRRCAELEAADTSDLEHLEAWRRLKRAEEDRLFHAVSYLVESPPITVSKETKRLRDGETK